MERRPCPFKGDTGKEEKGERERKVIEKEKEEKGREMIGVSGKRKDEKRFTDQM